MNRPPRPYSSKILFRRAVHVQSFQSPCTCTARRVLPSDFTPLDRANQELQNAFLDESLAQKEPKLWSFKVLRFFHICAPIIPYMGIQKAKIVKSVPTFHGHNFGSFWARDSSKKPFCSSWLALSNGVKSEGNTRRAVHVQGDWKLCTCTARRNKIFELGSRQPVHQLNETRRTVPNILYFERKVAPAIFGP